jgi:hypothetical protein
LGYAHANPTYENVNPFDQVRALTRIFFSMVYNYYYYESAHFYAALQLHD